jgi:hypothetical protein
MLDGGAGSIRIIYEASHAMRIRIAGGVHDVRSGPGTLELAAAGLPRTHGAVVLDVSLTAPIHAARFSVREVSAGGMQ